MPWCVSCRPSGPCFQFVSLQPPYLESFFLIRTETLQPIGSPFNSGTYMCVLYLDDSELQCYMSPEGPAAQNGSHDKLRLTRSGGTGRCTQAAGHGKTLGVRVLASGGGEATIPVPSNPLGLRGWALSVCRGTESRKLSEWRGYADEVNVLAPRRPDAVCTSLQSSDLSLHLDFHNATYRSEESWFLGFSKRQETNFFCG